MNALRLVTAVVRLVPWAALVCAGFTWQLARAQVELRGNAGAPAGEVVRVNADGILLSPTTASGKQASALVSFGWERVRAVNGPLSDQAAIYAPIATNAWRAQSRLARGDAVGAEPLFDALFAAYSRRAGPTSVAVAEGLATCRLGRGAQASAVAPWLVWLRAGGNDRATSNDEASSTLAGPNPDTRSRRFTPDAATGLIPSLPPIWIDLPAVRSFARAETALDPLDAGIAATASSVKAERLGWLFLAAAQQACGLDSPPIPDDSVDTGVKLVTEVVLAFSKPTDQREAARTALRARLRSKPAAWIETWARVAIGRSLILEDSADSKRQGVIELLHVPSRLPDEVPYLTGIALAEASVALHLMGDDAGADRLRHELITEYAGHPALDWAPLRGWKPPVSTPPAGPAGAGTEQPTPHTPGPTAPQSGGS